MKKGVFVIILIGIFAAIGLFATKDEGEEQSSMVSVTNFEECVEAGNPIMESYPRQCRHEGELFIEEIDEPITPPILEDGVTVCDPDNRPEACTQQYEPVCGLVQVECITTPCDPVPETFGNGCSACSNGRVISYTESECNVGNDET